MSDSLGINKHKSSTTNILCDFFLHSSYLLFRAEVEDIPSRIGEIVALSNRMVVILEEMGISHRPVNIDDFMINNNDPRWEEMAGIAHGCDSIFLEAHSVEFAIQGVVTLTQPAEVVANLLLAGKCEEQDPNGSVPSETFFRYFTRTIDAVSTNLVPN